MSAQASFLPDGRRLHLNHGPIDLIIDVNAAARSAAYALAFARFETVLEELVRELPFLRQMVTDRAFKGSVAQRMQAATKLLSQGFITPMAAVAGAVADEVLCAMTLVPNLTKAHVNNGGDIAFQLTAGQSVTAALAGGRVTLRNNDLWRGIATSGWRGRSHSLGIADAVTVIARTAATADAAATLIANAVDLLEHPAILRRPATDLSLDSDLGSRPVTVDVGPLSVRDAAVALDRGASFADELIRRGLIGGAHLALNTQSRISGVALPLTPDQPELTHA